MHMSDGFKMMKDHWQIGNTDFILVVVANTSDLILLHESLGLQPEHSPALAIRNQYQK
jgi:hypothetical protein